MRKLLPLLFLLFPIISYAAIGFQGAQIMNISGSPSNQSETVSFNASGTNPFIVCGDMNYTTDPVYIGMRYNSASMTPVAANRLNNSTGANSYANTFYIAGVPTGSSNVDIVTQVNVQHRWWCGEWTGVDQSTPVEATTTGVDTSILVTSTTTKVYVSTANDVIATVSISGSGRAHSPSTNFGGIFGAAVNTIIGSDGGMFTSGSGNYNGSLVVTAQSVGMFSGTITTTVGDNITFFTIAMKEVASAAITTASKTIIQLAGKLVHTAGTLLIY